MTVCTQQLSRYIISNQHSPSDRRQKKQPAQNKHTHCIIYSTRTHDNNSTKCFRFTKNFISVFTPMYICIICNYVYDLSRTERLTNQTDSVYKCIEEKQQQVYGIVRVRRYFVCSQKKIFFSI